MVLHFKNESKFAPIDAGMDPVYKTHVRKGTCDHLSRHYIECEHCNQKYCQEICLDEKFENLCPECRMEFTAFCKYCRKHDYFSRMKMCTSCKQYVCAEDQVHIHFDGSYHWLCDICIEGVHAPNPDRVS